MNSSTIFNRTFTGKHFKKRNQKVKCPSKTCEKSLNVRSDILEIQEMDTSRRTKLTLKSMETYNELLKLC